MHLWPSSFAGLIECTHKTPMKPIKKPKFGLRLNAAPIPIPVLVQVITFVTARGSGKLWIFGLRMLFCHY
jgi:hypothetical protein